MVREITGDLLRDGKGILCHQVNYFGVMGAGIAYSIANELLTPEQYQEYCDYCNTHGVQALGSVFWIKCQDGRLVANMFSQDESIDGCITDYDAMEACFRDVRSRALAEGLPVYIPGRIGCGIAGGNWEWVKNIIHYVFDGSPVEATIVNWERERKRFPHS